MRRISGILASLAIAGGSNGKRPVSNGNGAGKSNGSSYSDKGHPVNGESKSPNHRRITNHTLRSSSVNNLRSRKSKSRTEV